jgi:hypothetical protein
MNDGSRDFDRNVSGLVARHAKTIDAPVSERTY